VLLAVVLGGVVFRRGPFPVPLVSPCLLAAVRLPSYSSRSPRHDDGLLTVTALPRVSAGGRVGPSGIVEECLPSHPPTRPPPSRTDRRNPCTTTRSPIPTWTRDRPPRPAPARSRRWSTSCAAR